MHAPDSVLKIANQQEDSDGARPRRKAFEPQDKTVMFLQVPCQANDLNKSHESHAGRRFWRFRGRRAKVRWVWFGWTEVKEAGRLGNLPSLNCS